MSGTRHHFIPRFLQKGFASRIVGEAVFTWVFRKDKPPFETNTINVGAEGHFYADDDSDADRLITTEEARFAPLVDALRSNRHQQRVDDPKPIAEMLTHLVKRTRALRRGMTRLFDSLLAALTLPADGPELEATVVSYLTANPTIMRNALLRCGIDASMLSAIEPYVQTPLLAAGLRPLLRALHHEAPRLLESASKRGHIQSIERISTESQPPLWLGSLTYEVLLVDPPVLVLGDSAMVVVARRSDSSTVYRTLWDSAETLVAVILPLGPDLCLVGRVASQELDLQSVPSACVRCSSEFFIAPANTEAGRLLQPLIATGEPLLAGLDIESLLRESGWY